MVAMVDNSSKPYRRIICKFHCFSQIPTLRLEFKGMEWGLGDTHGTHQGTKILEVGKETMI
jgi:hypothetical protein